MKSHSDHLANESNGVKAITQKADYDRLLTLGRELLIALGKDPEDEGLRETPRRWASWWREFMEFEPGNTETVFNTITAGQLVVVSGIRVYSICEHHLLPFWCDLSIGYVTEGKVLGVSKFARMANKYAHDLQLQERMVAQIAAEIEHVLDTPDIAIWARGVHLCMLMRGIKTESTVQSLVTNGTFAEDDKLLANFLTLARQDVSEK